MRITTAHLENLTDWINSEKGYPEQAWVRVPTATTIRGQGRGIV